MKDIGKLVDALCEAYRMTLPPNGTFMPQFIPAMRPEEQGRWATHCNEAFNLICRRMGFDGFDRRDTKDPTDAQLANVIYAALNKPDGHWRQIDAGLAQRMANDGALVAAADSNVGRPGHVCAVMPGVLEHSGTFGEKVPRVLDIGKKVQLCVKASLAFRLEDKPRYFCLKEDFVPVPA